MPSRPLTLAVAQPRCTRGDVLGTAREHAELIVRARARVVMFPELSLTGYELDAPVVEPDDPAVAILVAACRDTGSVALVGAPVSGAAGARHIGVLRVDAAGAAVAYRKSFLGGAEPTRFTPGTGAVALDVDGWRIGLGVCKDTGVERHVRETAALGVDLYLAGLVDHVGDRAVQTTRAGRIARACAAHVGFASFAGATGGGYDATAGRSSIWSPAGELLAGAGADPGELARAAL